MHTPSPRSEFDKYDEPRLHMERLMNAKLIEFDISIRILIPLESAGIKTLGDLVSQTPESLKKIKLLGEVSIRKLQDFLSYHNLSLAKEKRLSSRQPSGATHIIK